MAFQLVIASSSVILVDYHGYKLAFSSKGLRDKFEYAICYVVQLGILDLEKADLDEVKEELEKCVTNIEDFRFLRGLILMGDLEKSLACKLKEVVGKRTVPTTRRTTLFLTFMICQCLETFRNRVL